MEGGGGGKRDRESNSETLLKLGVLSFGTLSAISKNGPTWNNNRSQSPLPPWRTPRCFFVVFFSLFFGGGGKGAEVYHSYKRLFFFGFFFPFDCLLLVIIIMM